MLDFIKKLLIIIFICCPFTFYGQSKSGLFPTKKSKKVAYARPIEDVRYDASYSYPFFSFDFGPSFLNADNAKLKWGNGASIGIGYQLFHIVGIECNFGYTALDGKYYQLEIQNLNCFEANANISFNLTNLLFGYDGDRKINVEPHIGIGQIQYKGHIIYNNGKHVFVGYDNNASNNSLGKGVHGRKVALAVPYGIDINYDITNKLKVHIDVSTCFTDTDNLDAIQNGLHYDWYSSIRIGVSYAWSRKGAGHKREYSPCEFTF